MKWFISALLFVPATLFAVVYSAAKWGWQGPAYFVPRLWRNWWNEVRKL